MQHIVLSKRKAEAISNALLLMALAILFWTNTVWPGILLAIWVWLGSRQYFSGRLWDFAITTIILIGLFIISFFSLNLSVLLPVLFVIGGIYIIFREFFFADDTNGEEKSKEISDDSDLDR